MGALDRKLLDVLTCNIFHQIIKTHFYKYVDLILFDFFDMPYLYIVPNQVDPKLENNPQSGLSNLISYYTSPPFIGNLSM